MKFRTEVAIEPSDWKIEPFTRILFVGSCFADNMGKRFAEEKFRAVVNPFGVMYNPVSILHTVQRLDCKPEISVFTLGTNHVYREKATGMIVDNCQKRPANLFVEEELTVDECVESLGRAADMVGGKVIITVSPIRYRKYGFHQSVVSKSVLMLAAERLTRERPDRVDYFPAYEIMNDELRDYRFYQPDMLHPSQQAVEYIYEKFSQAYFSDATNKFIAEWRPVKEALGHRPFNPDGEEYKAFLRNVKAQAAALKQKYPGFEDDILNR
jgi:hypothetical protein